MSASIRGKNAGPSISSSQLVAGAGAKSIVSWRRSRPPAEDRLDERPRLRRRDGLARGRVAAAGAPVRRVTRT